MITHRERPEYVFEYRTDHHLYVAVCLRCRVYIAANPQLKNLRIAEQEHRCEYQEPFHGGMSATAHG
jgi:hypothetical protein